MQTTSLPSRPRFRTDLVAECIEAEGQRFIDVIDPDTGDAFRFYEVEYSLACAMDGARDVHGLVQWAKEELGIEPARGELEQVITTLDNLGYLDAGAPAGVQRPAEIELEQGVIAPRPEAPRPSGIQVELGGAGAGKETRRMDELQAEEVELGLPGAPQTPASLRRATRPDSDSDGPTHLPAARVHDFDDEVSVDLSEHLSIRPSDVKEAVRASRSMKAVDVPQDLLAELEQKEQEAARAAARGTPAQVMEAEEPTPPPAELPRPPAPPAPIESPRSSPGAKAPVELPQKPVVVSRKDEQRPTAPAPKAAAPVEAPKGGTSPLLIVLLVLVILGAAAFFVWKYVLDKPKTDDTTETPDEPAAQGSKTNEATPPEGTTPEGTAGTGTTGTPEQAAKPATPPPEATLEASAANEAVKATSAGVVVFVAAKDANVQAGDPIVELQGIQQLKAKLGDAKGGLIWDIETRVPKEIETATKKRDTALVAKNAGQVKAQEAKIKERTKRLEEKKQEADDLRAKIEALTIAAPAAGAVTPSVKKGARVEKGQPVATIASGGSLVATFDIPDTTLKPDDAVRLLAKDKPEQKANCAVSAVDGAKVTVTCAADAGLAAGSKIVLEK